MLKTTCWARVAIVCAGAGVFALTSGGHEPPPPAPPPKEKPTEAEWIPKPGSDPGVKGGVRIVNGTADPPSAFPDLAIPVFPSDDPKGAEKRWAAFEKMCPRLFGTILLKIEPTDDTLRKLLKARLHQGACEFELVNRVRGPSSGPALNSDRYRENLMLDMQSAAVELWAKEPKELVPWLEELVVASKELERLTRLRVLTGTVPPHDLNAARRLRLKMEAELWKAKNPK